jgi:hypothetical protein
LPPADLTPEAALLLRALPIGIASAAGSPSEPLDPALIAAVRDGRALFELAAIHRVTPLLFIALKQHAEAIAGWGALEDRINTLRPRNLALAGELKRILSLFACANVDAIALKGLTLAQSAYGSLFAREIRDLDLLVRSDSVDAARAALLADGFEWLEAHLDPRADADYRRRKTHFTFHHPERGVHLELHWGLLRAPDIAAAALAPLWDRSRPADFLGAPMRALAPEDELFMLLLHGSKHLWSDLIWLCDLAAFLRAHPAVDWRVVCERAAAFRARHFIALGVLMASALLDLAFPAAALDAARADRAMSRLAADLIAHYFDPRPTPPRLTSAEFLRQLRLRAPIDQPGFIRYQLAFWQPSPADRAFLPLPRRLHFLYSIIRPIRLALKVMRGGK